MGRCRTTGVGQIAELAIVLAFTVGAPFPLPAQVQDTVILRSGLPVVGEVQRLARGSLSFDTEEMDVVSIDWDDIAMVRSSQFFEVELVSGAEYFGSLASADTAQLVVVGVDRTDTLSFAEVVTIRAFETGFFARTNGFLDLGTNIARANRLRSILFNGEFNYRGPKWGLGLAGELYYQRQTSVSSAGDTTVERTNRSLGRISGDRYLGARWAASAAGQVEKNDELDLDVRVLGVLGGQYRFVRNQGVELYAGAGGSLNIEQYTGDPGTTSGEVLVFGGLDIFDVGDIDLYTSIITYTSPAGGGRFRLYVDGRVAWEIFSDFSLGITVTQRVDTRPPSETAAKHDYQYALTIGWSWS